MYYGKEPWDGAPEPHDILNMEDIPEELVKYINNYQVHIIDVRRMDNTNVFQTDLRQIFNFLSCAENKEKLRNLVAGDETYRNMDEDAYDLLAEYTASEEMISMKKYQGEDGRIDMCKGLKDWAAEEREIGRSEGMEQGREFGIREGKMDNLKKNVENLMKSLAISMEKACELLGCSQEDYERLLQLRQ